MNEQQGLPTGAKVLIGGILLAIGLVILIALFPVVVIGAGQRGVVFNNGTGVENRILGEGFHFRTPLVESVTSLSIQVQKNEVKAEAASKDLQTVSTTIVVNWHLDASKVNKVYQNIGDEDAVLDRIINPAVSEVVKASVAKYTAEEVLQKRPLLKRDIDDQLRIRLAGYNIILNDVSITNVDFSKDFNAAIEAKQVAEQQAKQAGFLAQRAKNEADAAIETAKGQAEAQKLVQQSLTPELLQKMALEKWNGSYPQYVGGGLPLPTLPLR